MITLPPVAGLSCECGPYDRLGSYWPNERLAQEELDDMQKF